MDVQNMITSKDILDKAGISRATLNNYIKSGILPRPIVGPPRPTDKGVKQIGYFPEEVLGRIDRVRFLKGQGKNMEEIARIFSENTDQSTASSHDDSAREGSIARVTSPKKHNRITDRDLQVTIRDIHSPAYLINHNFEVEWINQQAEDIVFGKKVRSLVDIEARNIFKLFLERRLSGKAERSMDLCTLHLTVLQRYINDPVLSSLFKGISSEEIEIVKNLFQSRPVSTDEPFLHLPVSIPVPGGGRSNFWVHTMTFREGTFFVYLPEDGMNSSLLSMLNQRERIIGDLLKHRMPSLVSLCVLIADLQDSVRISAELLPAQYFELINGLWAAVGSTFEKHNGIYGKHVGDGMLYYFLDKPGDNYINNCINCAIELREIVNKFSTTWKGIKGWDHDLHLNTGINEGQEFFGTIHSANTIEFTALGDTINIAARLSEFAHDGEIWTTKNMISKLSQEERNTIRFGVHSKKRPGNGFIRDSFSRLRDLITVNDPHYRQLSAIGGLPITEIKDRFQPDYDGNTGINQ